MRESNILSLFLEGRGRGGERGGVNLGYMYMKAFDFSEEFFASNHHRRKMGNIRSNILNYLA